MDLNINKIKTESFLTFSNYYYPSLLVEDPKKRIKVRGKLKVCSGDRIDAQADNVDAEHIYLFSEKPLDTRGDLHPGKEFFLPPSPRVFLGFELLRDTKHGSLYSYEKEVVALTIEEVRQLAEKQLGRKISIEEDSSKCKCILCDGSGKDE